MIGFDTLATRILCFTVSASPVDASAVPYPFAYTSNPSFAIATDTPGTPDVASMSVAILSTSANPTVPPVGSVSDAQIPANRASPPTPYPATWVSTYPAAPFSLNAAW